MSFAPRSWHETTALFGGTFDPPHLGHREAVRGLFSAPGVKRVLVIPAATPPHKPVSTPVEDRVEMARLNFSATPRDPYPSDVLVDLREIWRAKIQGRPSYSYETLQELKRDIPDLAFVIGTDQLESLPQWYRFPEILELCHWIVLERKPDGAKRAEAVLKDWVASGLAQADERGAGPGGFRLRGGKTWLKRVPTEAPPLSSTQLRETLARTGQAPEGALIPEVLAYLKQRRLYGSSEVKS